MGNRGYTLLEVLVVLVILGVLSGFAVLALRGQTDSERLHEAADRFAALVRHQCEEALLGGRTLRLQVDDRGYRFEVLSRAGWEAHSDSVFRDRTWPVTLHARLAVDGLRPGETGSVHCLPTGEITPFELMLDSASGGRAGVRAAPDGTIERFGDRA